MVQVANNLTVAKIPSKNNENKLSQKKWNSKQARKTRKNKYKG